MKRIVRLFLMILPVVFTMGVARADNAQCLRGLATDLADTILGNVNTDDAVIITSDSLVEYFTKNIDICRDYLLARVSPDEDISVADIDLVMDIRWDYIVEEVAAALSVASNQRTLFVCENNRSYEMGIEVGLWVATVVAAAFSWGSGGVAIQGAKTAVVQAGKNFVKIGVRKGAKKAAVDATAKRLGIDIAAKAVPPRPPPPRQPRPRPPPMPRVAQWRAMQRLRPLNVPCTIMVCAGSRMPPCGRNYRPDWPPRPGMRHCAMH